DSDHDGVDDSAAAGADMFRQSEYRRTHRSGGMDDGFEVCVVEVKRMRSDAVDQRCIRDVDPLLTPKYGGLRCGLQDADGGKCGLCRFVTGGAHSAAQPIQEAAMRFMFDLVAPSARGVLRYELSQNARDGRCVVIGGDGGVDGHLYPASVKRVVKRLALGVKPDILFLCDSLPASQVLRRIVREFLRCHRHGHDRFDLQLLFKVRRSKRLIQAVIQYFDDGWVHAGWAGDAIPRSEEHTSELQSRENLVCR